jgi:hypothetical protein
MRAGFSGAALIQTLPLQRRRWLVKPRRVRRAEYSVLEQNKYRQVGDAQLSKSR